MSPVFLSLTLAAVGAAAPVPDTPAPLRAYLEVARASNLARQREALDVDAARARLAEARSFLAPRLEAVGRYTVSTGGRTIDIPVGDLVNPVYATLNELLAAEGQPSRFGTVENQSIRLLRPHEQETKLRLVQPVWRPEIVRAIEARGADLRGREARLAQFARELELEVRTAYFRWLQADAAVAIFDGAQELADENLRVQRSLFRNDKITEDGVLRAEAEALGVRQQGLSARKDRDLARSFFNFLLNRPLATPIERVTEEDLARHETDAIAWVRAPDANGGTRREELAVLHHAIAATAAAARAARARLFPSVGFVAEGGVEGPGYGASERTTFSQASIVASWLLFDGHERRARVAQADLERRKHERQLEEVRARIGLQIQQARDEALAAAAGLEAAQARWTAARRAYEIVDRRQHEGTLNFLAVLDARQELTAAELGRAIVRADVFIGAARLARAVGLGDAP
jgi:outer membrane protein TolC